jgi:hypothetical protein
MQQPQLEQHPQSPPSAHARPATIVPNRGRQRGGPADGHVQLMEENHHPFMMSMSTDTDGYYGMEYEVAGQRIGALELTSDDVIARWHQRSSSRDFMTGDTVIIKATGARATVFAPTTHVNANGTADEGWTIAIDSNLTFVAADEIRIAVPEELNNGDA